MSATPGTARRPAPSSLRVEVSPTPSDSTLSSGHTALVRSAEPESDVLLRHSTTPHCQNSPSTSLLHIVLVLFGRWRLRPGQLHLSPSPSYGHPSLTLHPPQSRGNTHGPMRVMTHCSGPAPPTIEVADAIAFAVYRVYEEAAAVRVRRPNPVPEPLRTPIVVVSTLQALGLSRRIKAHI